MAEETVTPQSTNNPPQMDQQSQVPANDLADSRSDQEHLKDEVIYMDMPEITDIPGQTATNPLPVNPVGDTISSADEEGLVNDQSDDDDYFAEGESTANEMP